MKRTILVLSTMTLAVLLASGVALASTTVVAERFSNTSEIFIPDCDDFPFEFCEGSTARADPYPSEIIVSGLNRARILDVNLTLRDFSHSFPDDVGVLLVGPHGQDVVVMRNVGNTDEMNGVNLTLDDEAWDSLPEADPITTGTYRPTQGESWRSSFPSPAPARPYDKALSVFDGTRPNGTWRLYVVDEAPEDFGRVGGGWSLRIKAQVRV